MKTQSETYHVLEIYGPRDQVWRPANDEIYREAKILAHYGEVARAIDEAETSRITSYGNMHGVRFRVVTTTKTITINAGEFE